MCALFEKYDIINTISDDQELASSCQRLRRKFDKKIFILKEIHCSHLSKEEKETLQSELKAVENLNDPNIVKYYEQIHDQHQQIIYLVIDYCHKGDLASLIQKCKREREYLQEHFIWKILYQVALALQACYAQKFHQNKLLQYSVKPANIFLDKHENAKLGGFCLSTGSSSSTSSLYLSPEQMNCFLNNEKSDVWALGCLIYELCSLNPPFAALSQSQMLRKMKDGQLDHIPTQFSEELNTIINFMLAIEITSRPSIPMILNHQLVLEKVSRHINTDCGDALPSRFYIKGTINTKKKERLLWKREMALHRKEKELSQKEDKLCNQMKSLKDQMERAEKFLSECNKFAKTVDLQLLKLPADPLLDSQDNSKSQILKTSQPKHVHFEVNEKEKRKLKLPYKEKKDGAPKDKENKSKLVPVDFQVRRSELEERLNRAQAKALKIRTQEIQPIFQNKFLPGLR